MLERINFTNNLTKTKKKQTTNN